MDSEEQSALLELSAGPVQIRANLRMTPAGLLSVGVLVSGILLSTSVVVWTATSALRRHPIASRVPLKL